MKHPYIMAFVIATVLSLALVWLSSSEYRAARRYRAAVEQERKERVL